MVPTTFDAQPLTRDLMLINIHNERAEHLRRMLIAAHLKSCTAELSRPIPPVDRLCCRCQIVNGLGARKQTVWPYIARDRRNAGVLQVFRTSSGLSTSSPCCLMPSCSSCQVIEGGLISEAAKPA
jgi:hypothetical protein